MTTDFSPYYRLWALQLLAEFEDIRAQYGLALEAPIFEISETLKQYGSWQATSRMIRISSHLITSCSWDVTCLILKHEMAHQICSELFHNNTSDHGPLFQRACQLLGLPASYRHASSDLPGPTTSAPAGDARTEKGRQFIIRIGKLLALATSANEHEAALAMEKASQLMTRHNLQQLQEDAQSAFASLIIHTRSQRLESWQRKICVILLQFFYVKVVTSSLYDPLRHAPYKTIEIFGREENVTVAEYCYTFLAGQLASLWQQNRSRINGKGIRVRNSYYLGLLQGFYDKLKAQKALTEATNHPTPTMVPRDGDGTAIAILIRAEDAALDQFVGLRFPRLRRRSEGKSFIYRETYEQGRVDGQQIVLHKGVADQGGGQGLLLAVNK
ncbi:MAG: DUF2786 domain-containing protein [Desulfobulbaceae bacterium]|jgi:hypothetical protein|nr:DUF2786 domain-containing protein [Desulfobulbaceae bacterium]